MIVLLSVLAMDLISHDVSIPSWGYVIGIIAVLIGWTIQAIASNS